MGNDTTELALASLELATLEACVELMFWAAYADGKVDPEERAVFEAHVTRATAGQLKPDLIRVVLRQIEGTVAGADRSASLRSIARRLTEPRRQRAALVLAATVAAADGQLRDEERVFLEQAGEAFGIAKDEVADLIAAARG
jgi:tellurite resistance protein